MARWRPALKLWHRWFGIGAGLWLALLAVTGCAIAWYDEIDTALNPDWRTVPASITQPVAIDTVVAQAMAALPGFAAGSIELAARPGDVHWLIGRAPGADGKPKPVQLFADPASGRVLGWRLSGTLALDRRHAMDVVYGLHTDLLLGPVAAWLLGLVALLWVIDHGVGLALALPHGEAWRDAFRLAGRRGSLRRLFDWHRAKGMWAWPLTAMLAITGLTLAWPETSRDAIRIASPVGERMHEAWPERTPPTIPIGIDRAMDRVTDDRTRIHSVRLLPHLGSYAVRTFDPRDPDDQGRLWTYVRMNDGAITGRRHDNGDSAGDAFFAWQYPLHSGKAAGAAGRALVTLGGIAALWLCVSGARLWWRRRRPARS